MKVAIVVDPPPWSPRTQWYIREIEASRDVCAVIVVDRPPQATRRARYLKRKYGTFGGIPQLAAAAWFRRYTRRISQLQNERFERLLGAAYQPTSPVLKLGTLNGEQSLAWFRHECPDVVVPIGGGIVKPALLEMSTWIRWHHGITPDIRGAAAPFWAVYHNKPQWLGITVQQLVEKIDAGPILAQRRLVPADDDDLATVYVKLDELCLPTLIEVLDKREAGALEPQVCDPSQGEYFSSPELGHLVRFPQRQRTFFQQFRSGIENSSLTQPYENAPQP